MAVIWEQRESFAILIKIMQCWRERGEHSNEKQL
jgi:hypothetical protein